MLRTDESGGEETEAAPPESSPAVLNDAGFDDVLDTGKKFGSPDTPALSGPQTADATPAVKREPAKADREDAKENTNHDQESHDNEVETGEDDGEKLGVWGKLRKHPIAIGVSIVVLCVAIVLGLLWYLNARHFESTDDAFVDGRVVAISPEVVGRIVSVPVNDNQIVRAGDLLVEIDGRDYRASLHQAIAQIAQAEASVAIYRAQIESQRASVNQIEMQGIEAQSALGFSQDQNKRAQDLVKKGFGTVQTAQQDASDLVSKGASLDASKAALVSAQRQIDVFNAQVQGAEAQIGQAQSQKELADANLSRTQIHATFDGHVTRLTAAVGAVATQAQALMILVPLDLWVTANFKETQLADMKAGQAVDIEIDSLGKTFAGHVNSLQAGSGTAFSLLPAENATGNYVKVVQRVPVKITFDELPKFEIGPGMSVIPNVKVR